MDTCAIDTFVSTCRDARTLNLVIEVFVQVYYICIWPIFSPDSNTWLKLGSIIKVLMA